MWMGSKPDSNHRYHGPKDQWIELKNVSGRNIPSLKGFYLTYKKASSGNENKLVEISYDEEVRNGATILLSYYSENNSAINKLPDDKMSAMEDYDAFQIKLYLKKNSNLLIDIAGDGKSKPSQGDTENFYSMERNASPGDGSDYNNWHTCSDPDSTALYWDTGETERGTPTPNKESSTSSSNPPFTDENSSYAGKVFIDEIKADTNDEFIELINKSNADPKIFDDWCVRDETQHKKSDGGACKKISGKAEIAKKFITLNGNFSLNNDSEGDTVYLYDENKKLVDSVKYLNAKKACYYALSENDWRWTSQATPSAKNIFDPEVSARIKKDSPVYLNIYAYFSATPNDYVKKVYWNFGDDHGSTLEDTKHKYAKNKKYSASLDVFGVCETKTYAFEVDVKKFQVPKIRIVKISPNPKGSDTENEWIEIENRTKKKINLKGWSVATGWDNLVNHPIREDFFIKTGKTKRLSHDICAFTLTNAKNKLELRDPSGKAVQKIQYDHGKKSIQEETLYQKKEGGNWEWSEPATTEEAGIVSAENKQLTKITAPAATPVVPEIPAADLGKYSLDPAWQKKQHYQIELATFSSTLKITAAINNTEPRVLGARVVIYDENYYTFTENIPQKHWVITFAETFWLKINSGINRVLNVI